MTSCSGLLSPVNSIAAVGKPDFKIWAVCRNDNCRSAWAAEARECPTLGAARVMVSGL